MWDNPYYFDLDENSCPIFTPKNFELVKALIRYDSNYGPTEDSNEYAMEGKTLYPKMLEEGFPKDEGKMRSIVDSMDAVNSTHLASQGKRGGNAGREITTAKILQITDLEEKLKNKNDKVVIEIAEAVEGKFNISFATKFCAFTSLYALGSDNYCIYDSIIQKILPYYVVRYGLHPEVGTDLLRTTKKGSKKGARVSAVEEMMKTEKDYNGDRGLIDNILRGVQKNAGLKIEYRQFDQLIWYYFKGRDVLIQNSLNNLSI